LKTIIITGISGFVGENLRGYLAEEDEVIGLSRHVDSEWLTYTAFFKNKQRYDVMVHLAGKAHDLKNISNDKDYFDANFELTKQMFDSFLRSDAQKFIYISSVKAVADTVVGVLTEETLPNPITAYGKSKLAAENYILRQELPATKKVYILRPCMIHGPNNKGNLNLLYNFVSKGIPYPFGKYDNERSFVSIDNLCFIIKELLLGNVQSGIYNISDDETISTNSLVKMIGELIERPAKIFNIPKSVVNVLAQIGDIIQLPINTERVDKLTENYRVSNAKIKKVLAIENLPISIKQGLKKTIISFNNKK
jgi:nucleoside-diphosphate-sugar epimerase